MQSRINKDQWVAMFEDIGLNDAAMERWHRLFESRHPEAHQGFLEWLGIDGDEISRIRQHCR
jgi:hypothetical protein